MMNTATQGGHRMFPQGGRQTHNQISEVYNQQEPLKSRNLNTSSVDNPKTRFSPGTLKEEELFDGPSGFKDQIIRSPTRPQLHSTFAVPLLG